ADAAADHQTGQHIGQSQALSAGQLEDQGHRGQGRNGHADHAEEVAADRGGRVRKPLERLNEADAGDQIQEGDEHASGDQEATEDVDRGQGHGQGAHCLAQRGDGEGGGQHGADDHDRRDGVGHGHQRGVQGGGDVPDHVVADVDRQHEDDQVVDAVRNHIHVRCPLAVGADDLPVAAHQARG
ncbi:Uncharacterized protein APZ42_002014, partial [Daphnia magna]